MSSQDNRSHRVPLAVPTGRLASTRSRVPPSLSDSSGLHRGDDTPARTFTPRIAPPVELNEFEGDVLTTQSYALARNAQQRRKIAPKREQTTPSVTLIGAGRTTTGISSAALMSDMAGKKEEALDIEMIETDAGALAEDHEKDKLWSPDEPVVIPMLDPREDRLLYEMMKEEKEAEERDPMFSIMTLDEKGSTSDVRAMPFHDSSGMLQSEQHMFLVQMPSRLPVRNEETEAPPPPVAKRGEVPVKQHEFEVPPFRGNLGSLEGYMGKLQVHKSGRVTFMLSNGVTMDVEKGSHLPFLEELLIISEGSKECYRLGAVEGHVMIMPNTDSMGLTDEHEKAPIDVSMED